ncbi:unnamed protein product [Moneuplotes crassus]|uniref:Uncharacterized protein n=1 Tax=Euplotes crassus TaxID=5936 RepID=A0AAD1XFJ1_EUPCR|nr:unnamed protein product [Moneuplotes crassus]
MRTTQVTFQTLFQCILANYPENQSWRSNTEIPIIWHLPVFRR